MEHNKRLRLREVHRGDEEMTAEQFTELCHHGEYLILEPNSGVIGYAMVTVWWASWTVFMRCGEERKA